MCKYLLLMIGVIVAGAGDARNAAAQDAPRDAASARLGGVVNWSAASAQTPVANATPVSNQSPSSPPQGTVAPAGFQAPVASPLAGGRPAAAPLTYEQQPLAEPPSVAAMLVRLFLGTAAALGLCAATLYFGRRWLQGGLAGLPNKNSQLKVVEMLSLGSRCSLFLLQAGGAQVLAGVDAQGLKSLVVLPEGFDRLLQDQLPAPREASAPSTATTVATSTSSAAASSAGKTSVGAEATRATGRSSLLQSVASFTSDR